MKNTYSILGYKVCFSYFAYLRENTCKLYESSKLILIFSNIDMNEKEIETFLRKKYPALEKIAQYQEKKTNKIKELFDSDSVKFEDVSLAKNPIHIIEDIQQHVAAEWNVNARQKVIGRSGIIIDGENSPTKIWISNREYQMTSTVQKNILGAVVGTQSSNIVELLGTDGIVSSKNTRMGRLLSENVIGDHTCKTPKGTISFKILSRAFFQSTNEGAKGLRLNYDGKSKNFPNAKVALETLNSEAKGLPTSTSYQNRIIREQATLRLNPFLDQNQNNIKFGNVHDGTCVVIDGGPGTGKTTTLIQRLKLLINQYDLEDYRLNYNNCTLTDSQIAIVADSQRNWLFFSPNNLMRKYLRANMVYEGLSDVDRKTVVWSQYLPQIVKSFYFFTGMEESPFTYDGIISSVFVDGVGLESVKSFSKYVFRKVDGILESAANVDVSKFTILKKRIIAISKVCSQRGDISTFADIISIISKLQAYSELYKEQLGLTIKQVQDNYEILSRIITNYFILDFKAKPEIWNQLTLLVKKWNTEKHALQSANKSILDIENTLLPVIKHVVNRVAIYKFGDKLTLDVKGKEVYQIVGSLIEHDRLKELGEYSVYRSYVNQIAQSPDTFLFDKISAWYKNYRSELLKNNDYSIFTKQALNQIVKERYNRVISFQEMALYLGIVNNISRELLKFNRARFENSHNTFITAYRNCCIPVIGIDEATDYSLLDYYAIASLRDYRVSSVTLCGDLMQCMRPDGITDWQVLKDSLLFESLNVKQLTVSYRQSPELMKLADKLYEITVGKPSPYSCNIEDEGNAPRPLWYDNSDVSKRANWIADRIIDIRTAYSVLPSIAIFAKDQEAAQILESILANNRSLAQAGITVADCTNKDFVLEQPNRVRIFEIDKVKGMEFDAVFFFDIDTVSVGTDAINRFLYVGLSRAAFFIAVTTSGSNSHLVSLLKSCFDQVDNWNPAKSERITVGIDLGDSTTKVCIETERDNTRYHKLLEFNDEDTPYCLPTQVHLCSDWTLRYGSIPNLKDGKSVISSMMNFKDYINSENSNWDNILPKSYVIIWFITYVLFAIREQYDSNIQIQFGIKADQFLLSRRKKNATSMILSAIRLMNEVYDRDFDKFKSASVQELQTKTTVVPYSDELKNDNHIQVLPESYASIYMLSLCYSFQTGVHLHVDIGHFSSRLTFFEVYNSVPYICNTLEIDYGTCQKIGNEESKNKKEVLYQQLIGKATEGYQCLKYLKENNQIKFQSGILSKKNLHKTVSYWGGGSLDGSFIYPDHHKPLNMYPGICLGKQFELKHINLYETSIIGDQLGLYTVAIGLSHRFDGDNICFKSFELFPIPTKAPTSVPSITHERGIKSKYTHYRQGVYTDTEYRKIINSYQKPRVQKMTPEGYEHGLTEY